MELLKLYYDLLNYQTDNLKDLKDLISMLDIEKGDSLKDALDTNFSHMMKTQKEMILHFEDIVEEITDFDEEDTVDEETIKKDENLED